MKTVELQFVVEDCDVVSLHNEIKQTLDRGGLADFPLFQWREKKSSKAEVKWLKWYEKEYSKDR